MNDRRYAGHRIAAAVLAAGGCAIAVYLASYQMRITSTVWDPIFGAESRRVLDSALSHAFQRRLGAPDAALGALAYATELVLAVLGSAQRWRVHPWLVVWFGANVAALAIASAALLVLQAFVIRAWCALCLASAGISFALAALASGEVRAAVGALRHAPRARVGHIDPGAAVR
jgi:uncharacterized membrane protein